MVSGGKSSPQEIFGQFDRLNQALIDASSIIYAGKAGFLGILAGSVKLFAISEVLWETGPVPDSILPLKHHTPSVSNDDKLVSCALHFNLAVISEDKKILMAMKGARRPFFNSLMMLNFLLYRRLIDARQYARYHRALKQFARYSGAVWEHGAKIHAAIVRLK